MEDLIRSIPEIEDVAVIGVSDHKHGEVPRAYIVVKKSEKISEAEIHDFVNSQVNDVIFSFLFGIFLIFRGLKI